MNPKTPPCSTCDNRDKVRLTDGKEVYPHRTDLFIKPIWKCDGCGGYVGCHPGTTDPLGFPADKETRTARMKLHNERLDPLWRQMPKKQRKAARSAVYDHLANCMGISRDNTHTGMFSLEQCREAWRCLSKLDRNGVAALLKGGAA